MAALEAALTAAILQINQEQSERMVRPDFNTGGGGGGRWRRGCTTRTRWQWWRWRWLVLTVVAVAVAVAAAVDLPKVLSHLIRPVLPRPVLRSHGT